MGYRVTVWNIHVNIIFNLLKVMLVQRQKNTSKSKHAKYGIVALKNHVPLS
jgi:chemotaxis receptor (MCP) glutamine deamidase CheD